MLNLYFNTKFVIAKFHLHYRQKPLKKEFQYKICYSKIFLVGIIRKDISHFNTKFVIAKLEIYRKLSGRIDHFNTKFVIAKCNFKFFN